METILKALSIVCWVCFLVSVQPTSAVESSGEKWTSKQMGDPGTAKGSLLKLPLLPANKEYPAGFNCREKPATCEFELAYFRSDGFDLTKKGRLNILFIPGGPGAIVDPGNQTATLQRLGERHNVVYFHPRGMGGSAIDGSKTYDQFLRADYVVEDIERLRREVLHEKPWDAIYAHSWGTVIAQRYAAKYGKPKDGSPKVRSLILSGPVDRHRTDTHSARTRMIVDNLKAIYSYYRSAASRQCQCRSDAYLRPLVTDYASPQIRPVDTPLEANDNFCFLPAGMGERIAQELEKLLPRIDENYGSADFVADNYLELKKNDRVFQSSFSKFPVEFFAAIRYLQMTGAPEKDGLVFVAESHRRIDAALILAYYLATINPDRCSLKSGIFAGTAESCDYCERFKAASKAFQSGSDGRESQRGSYVFGAYDGVARWVSLMMGKKGCFTGKEMEQFANSNADTKRFGRDQVGKIGIVPDDKICPWNPADYRHEVPTLLIKGDRDTVVAGCQAEDFLLNGLKQGSRILLEFKGLGHDVGVADLHEGIDPSVWSGRFVSLLEDFIKMAPTPAKFRADAGVKKQLQRLKAVDRTNDPKITAQCGKNS